jgi:hypothetical protein
MVFPVIGTPSRLLGTCVLALILSSCGNEAAVTDSEPVASSVETGNTNIRLAKRDANDEFVEAKQCTRDPDHLGQIMPARYQNEGPAWENENIAFRMYWDERNGIDIHGKKVRDMVLDTVGLDRNNYHEMSDWGMDVLKAGNSLGAGTIAFLIDGEVYRLGDAREEIVEITEESRQRSAFQLDYTGLEIGGREIDLGWDIAIESGTHGYEATVTATGLRGGEELLIGIVNLHADTLYTLKRGDRFVAYTHGPQAELEHYLGMAMSVDSAVVTGHGELGPDEQPISSTYYVSVKLEEGKPVTYRFTAGWAPGHPEFERREAFQEVIY